MHKPEPFRIRLEDLVSNAGTGRTHFAKASAPANRWTLDAADLADNLSLSEADQLHLQRQLRAVCDELESGGTASIDAIEFELLREQLVTSRAGTFARGRSWAAQLTVEPNEVREWLDCLRDVPG